jgi:maleylpyruvate isomerase
MSDLRRDLRGAIEAHRVLEPSLVGLSEWQVRQASVLPNWTVGHVLTHIARNADGFRRLLEGALRGEVAEMYPGGLEHRNADIEAGALRTAEALVDDVRMSAARLELAFESMTDEAWAREGSAPFGTVALADVPFRRCREVHVHHADLGLGFTWRDWPTTYVRVELQRMTMLWNSRRSMGLTGLPPQALAVDDHHRTAWLLGRADIDGLDPAGLMT